MPDDRTLSSALAVRLRSSKTFVVLFRDGLELDELTTMIEAMNPPGRALRTTRDVQDAFANPSDTVLLRTENEVGTLETLDGRREQLLDRSAPVVLFLLSKGSGLAHLSDTPSLVSWIGGGIVDPEMLEAVDVGAARAAFAARTGYSPEEWLTEYDVLGRPATDEAVHDYQQARFLEGKR